MRLRLRSMPLLRREQNERTNELTDENDYDHDYDYGIKTLEGLDYIAAMP
jgi:hypothetical protein